MAIPQLARCAVHIDGTETPYLRAGHGEPVVVLLEQPAAVRDIEELVAVLSPHHRLTIPALAPDDRTAALQMFLDGIGLMHANLMAADSWAIPALAFVLTEPDRVARLALVESRPGGSAAIAGSIQRVGETGHPLFVALGGAYNDERSGFHISLSMADALIHFFSGDARGSA